MAAAQDGGAGQRNKGTQGNRVAPGRQIRTPSRSDHLGAAVRQCHHILPRTHGNELAIPDGNGIGLRVGAVKRGKAPVHQNQFGLGGSIHGEAPVDGNDQVTGTTPAWTMRCMA